MNEDLEPVERRASARDLRRIDRTTQNLNDRVLVLETRLSHLDERLRQIVHTVEASKVGIQKVFELLNAHTLAENKDRVRLLFWIITTLLSVLGFAGALLLQRLLT